MPFRLLRAISLCSLAALPPSTATPPATDAAPAVIREVELTSPGGALAARYQPASSGRGRAVLVIGANAHPLEETGTLTSRLQERGYSALAIAYPSHIGLEPVPGQVPALNPYAMRNSSLPAAMRDASSGIAFLAKDPGAEASSVLLIGIGLGANLAAMLGAHDARVAALGLLDPGGSCDPTIAKSALDGFRGRPALLVARRDGSNFRRVFLSGNDPLRTSIDSDEPDAAGHDELPDLDRVINWILDNYPAEAP